MRLPIILQKDTHFACSGCGDCCRQPYRVLIDAGRARALQEHDFSRYPRLAGRRFFVPSTDGRAGTIELAKGEGHRCLFLDDENRCIIHRELGPDAKPAMCREFPYLASTTWTERRVSASFACPSVRRDAGPSLRDQPAEIAECLQPIHATHAVDARVVVMPGIDVTQAEFDQFATELLELFGDDRQQDIWTRFAAALEACMRLAALPQQSPAPHTDRIAVAPFDTAAAAPLPARMLFAVTLYPDAVPEGAPARLRLRDRLLMIPRLMSLSGMTGGYASRLLGRNVCIDAVLRHEVGTDLGPDATRLLLRYFRARFWQRLLIGTRLSVLAGLHQHILDFNAIVFLARAEALATGASRLTEPLIAESLARVEFHIANQPRLYHQALRHWLLGALNEPAVAVASLRLMKLARPAAPAQTEQGRASVSPSPGPAVHAPSFPDAP